ncbi:phage Baseplate Assembly protein V [Enterobacter cloacae]|nr:phage Baseplate Assembly protein V [Enterobacter cloacae]
MKTQLNEILRQVRNILRLGYISDVDLVEGLCRVQTGGMKTTWLNWLTCRAGRSRVWWAPSVGEQVLLLAIGGELDTAFVLPAFSRMTIPRRLSPLMRFMFPFLTGLLLSSSPKDGQREAHSADDA